MNYLMLVVQLKKPTDYNTEIAEIEKKLTDHNHDKCITTPEFNKFTADVFDERLTQANAVTKTDFDTKLISLNKKINSNKTKHLLVENEFKKLETFDSIHFKRWYTKHLVFQPMFRYFMRVAGVGTGNYIYFWNYKELSGENITAPTTSDYGLHL